AFAETSPAVRANLVLLVNLVIFTGVGVAMIDVFSRVMAKLEAARGRAPAWWLTLVGAIGGEVFYAFGFFGFSGLLLPERSNLLEGDIAMTSHPLSLRRVIEARDQGRVECGAGAREDIPDARPADDPLVEADEHSLFGMVELLLKDPLRLDRLGRDEGPQPG